MSEKKSKDKESNEEPGDASKTSKGNPVCGLVMPISAIDGCTEKHWAEVREILETAVDIAKFSPQLVSDADDVGVIHKRIIKNLYQNDIVVCDVSAKNPNVMFELGVRLAFDKPVVIVKDDQTDYSFDTSAIEHLSYPRGLRFAQIGEFQEQLANKIVATHKASKSDPEHSSFLKNFGKFQTVQIETKEVTSDEAVLELIQEMRNEMRRMRMESRMIQHSDRDDHSRAGHFIPALARSIKSTTKIMGLRGKTQPRELREIIMDKVEDELPARHYFRKKDDFVEAFNAVFDTIF